MDSEEYKNRFFTTASHGFVSIGIAIGYELGLFDALRELKLPVTSGELSDKCKLKERYVREWLNGMVAAQLVCLSEDSKYYIPEVCKPHTEISFISSLIPMIYQSNYKKCIQCFKADGPSGFDYEDNSDMMMWMSEEGRLRPQKFIDEELFPLGFIKNGNTRESVTGFVSVQKAMTTAD